MNNKLNNNWNKVWIIHGDSCLCNIAVNSTIEDNNISKIIRYDKYDNISDLKFSLSAFNFMETDTAIILTDPTNDMLKICLDSINKNLCLSALIIIYPDSLI